jgi:DNA invertase Pin-like site-specific DNA recombinase
MMTMDEHTEPSRVPPQLVELKAAAADVKGSRSRLEELVRGAYAAGLPVSWIARAAGLARSSIYQIVKKQKAQHGEGS